MPKNGQIVVFNRWYGRVLVEGDEGFVTGAEWGRAYRGEINQFRRVLADSRIRLVKLFLHITPDEQLQRFHNRLVDSARRWSPPPLSLLK